MQSTHANSNSHMGTLCATAISFCPPKIFHLYAGINLLYTVSMDTNPRWFMDGRLDGSIAMDGYTCIHGALQISVRLNQCR